MALGSNTQSTSAPSLPTGFVAFLFSDIEGSTKRWELHPDAMRTAVARHESLMRDAIGQNGGFVFKTVGDAFCAAFQAPQQALHAAVVAQRSLSEEDFSTVDGLRVRIGIHAGTADERDGDYFGPTVNRVARLVSIGHGGQVLISDRVREIVDEGLPDGSALIDLGQRRLKDLLLPEHVWQLTIAGLPSEFAPLTSLDERLNNLPIQTTALLGREKELEAVKTMSAAQRLVTVAGAGGVGKTRLALQIGADMIDRYEHGVWFIDLAPISDGALAASVIGQALELTQSGDSAETAVLAALKRRSLLIILDNCEHILNSIAPLANAILKTCPRVRVLATSRQPLGIAGEFVHRLPSLAMPEPSRPATAEDVKNHGATALFVERAKASDSRFTLTDETAPVVADICRHLDGIPFAIELAAARVRVLSLPNLARRLGERFKILTGGNRTALPRQKTLSALIEWSYGLLDSKEQTLFNRLGIFAGGFSIEAVEAVCMDEGEDASDALDVLSSLADKSLILAETSAEQERYRLLESTRAFALDKLDAEGERGRLALRHTEYFLHFAQVARVVHRSHPAEAWISQQEPEIDNLRAALGWALQHDQAPVLGAAIAGSLLQLWFALGLVAEGRQWIAMALERIDADAQPAIAAALWLVNATLLNGERSYELAGRALAVFERIGDQLAAADSLFCLTWQCTLIDKRSEADATIERAEAIYRSAGLELGVARCIGMRAIIAEQRQDYDLARALHRESMAKFKALGDEKRVAAVLTNLGASEFHAGNTRESQTYFSEALEIFLRKKDARDLTIVYDNIAINHIKLDEVDAAQRAGLEALRHASEMNDEMYISSVLITLGCVAFRSGATVVAARILGFFKRQRDALGLAQDLGVHLPAKWLASWLEDRLEPAELKRLEAEGASWSFRQATDEAMKI